MTGAFGFGLAAGLPMSAMAAASGSTALPRPSGLRWVSGGYGDRNGLIALRQRPLDVTNTFCRRGTWSAIRDMGGYYRSLPASPSAVIISYPLFPDEMSPKTHGSKVWRAAAGGAFDAHHAAAAAGLPRNQRFILRAGWEWNLSWSAWSCLDKAHANDFAAYFRRIVDRFRESQPDILIDWCSNHDSHSNAHVEHFYPGGSHVDYIGIDIYDSWPALRTQSIWNAEYMKSTRGGPKGSGAWLAFARSLGKKLRVGEWGVVGNSPNGGGDNPLFVTRLLELFKANAADIGYECYFNNNTSRLRHRLADFPRSAAAYRAMTRSA